MYLLAFNTEAAVMLQTSVRASGAAPITALRSSIHTGNAHVSLAGRYSCRHQPFTARLPRRRSSMAVRAQTQQEEKEKKEEERMQKLIRG